MQETLAKVLQQKLKHKYMMKDAEKGSLQLLINVREKGSLIVQCVHSTSQLVNLLIKVF